MLKNIQGKLISRNITIDGHRTSLRLEGDAWTAFEEICVREQKSIHEMCSEIEQMRTGPSRTAAVRAYILAYFRAAASCEGHSRAGHGCLGDTITCDQARLYFNSEAVSLVGA